MSLDGCLGSSLRQRASAVAAVVVAEERKGKGPEGYTRSHCQVPWEGEEVGLQKEGGQEQFHPPSPVSPLAP